MICVRGSESRHRQLDRNPDRRPKDLLLSPAIQRRRDRFSRTNVEAQVTHPIIVHILKPQG